MKTLYESEIADMTRLLEETVDDFSKAYEVSVMEPLFCVSNKQLLLMQAVAHFSNYQVLNGCRHLCIAMCKQMGLQIKEIAESEDVDFILEKECKSIGILVSLTSNFMPNVSDEIMDIIDKLMVIVLQDTMDRQPQFYKPNSHKYRNYKHKDRIEQITIKQFFEMLGRDDYEDFKECVERYNYDAEQKLGITVSAIPTKKAVEKLREKIRKELLSYFYENELQTIFRKEEISDMKKWFEKNYVILVSNANFSRSIISSEWYYDLQVKTDGGREKTGQDRLPLNYENQKLVLTMANNILRAIKGNKKIVLRKTKMTDRVIGYLEKYIEKTRNAYMHKDNLYEWSDIQKIRTKTFAIYFMVLGTFFIDLEKLSHIKDNI